MRRVMTKIGEGGRIVIPRIQDAVRAYIPEGSNLADELIAERRREGRMDEVGLDASALLDLGVTIRPIR